MEVCQVFLRQSFQGLHERPRRPHEGIGVSVRFALEGAGTGGARRREEEKNGLKDHTGQEKARVGDTGLEAEVLVKSGPVEK